MRSYVPAAIVAATAGPAPAQDSAQAVPWGVAEVDAYVAANITEDTSEADDPFAVPASPTPPAESIVLRIPLERQMSEGNGYSPTWEYDATTQTLTLKVFPTSAPTVAWDWEGHEPTDIRARYARVGGFLTHSEEKTIPGGTRQNSYGAQVDVTTHMTISRGIMMRGSEMGHEPLPRHDGIYYEHAMQIAPELARALVENLELVVVAKPKPWRPNDWVICGSTYFAPTVRNPRETISNECFLTTDISGVGYIDKRDGTVLREWSR